ncbi:MAG: carboxyl transferase domain-containing protein [Polyangiaceae bacterium]
MTTLDIEADFRARTIITCLARIGEQPVGIVANQPNHMGGILGIIDNPTRRSLHADL